MFVKFLIFLLLTTLTFSSSLQYFFHSENLYISDSNYSQIIKKQFENNEKKLFAILFTNKNCQNCYQMEKQLLQIITALQKINVPTYRCELIQTKKLAQIFNTKRFPVIDFIYKEQAYRKKEYTWKTYKSNTILNQEQIIVKAKYLKIVLNDQKFKAQNLPSHNLIILNKNYLEEEVGISFLHLRKNYMLSDLFSNLLIVALQNDQFAQYLQKNTQFSDEVNGVISVKGGLIQNLDKVNKTNKLQKKIIQTMLYPINQYTYQNFDSTIKQFLFYTVNEFSQALFNIQRQTSFQKQKVPQVFIAIVDSIWNRNQTLQHISMLNKVLNKFQKEIYIYWMETAINKQKKTLLGFKENDQPPLFAKFVLQGQSKILVDSKGIPIFNQQKIVNVIKLTLGYEKQLPQKIKQSLENFDIIKFISINKFQNDQKKPTYPNISLTLCTGYSLKQHQLAQFYYTGKRIQRFHKFTQINIFTQSGQGCIFPNIKIRYGQGIYIINGNNIQKVSSKVQKCLYLQDELLKIVNSFQPQQKLLPDHFCVKQCQMRDYLLEL